MEENYGISAGLAANCAGTAIQLRPVDPGLHQKRHPAQTAKTWTQELIKHASFVPYGVDVFHKQSCDVIPFNK